MARRIPSFVVWRDNVRGNRGVKWIDWMRVYCVDVELKVYILTVPSDDPVARISDNTAIQFTDPE